MDFYLIYNKMKRIKLFENFNVLDPIEVRDDIKSVLYELTDLGVNINFQACVVGPGTAWEAIKSAREILAEDLESYLSENPTSKVIFFSISVLGIMATPSSDIESMKWFHELLTDHLDYIDPKKILFDEYHMVIQVNNINHL